jgi:hypothetical protein
MSASHARVLLCRRWQVGPVVRCHEVVRVLGPASDRWAPLVCTFLQLSLGLDLPQVSTTAVGLACTGRAQQSRMRVAGRVKHKNSEGRLSWALVGSSVENLRLREWEGWIRPWP